MKPIELNISPWPWRHAGYGLIGDIQDNLVARVESSGTTDADANIVAEAPEMYECLREAVNESCKVCYSYGRDDGQCHLNKHDSCFIQRWRAVLAKAAGDRE